MQQEEEFFDFDKADYGLVPVQCEVWEGFVFVNLDPDNTTSASEYLGDMGAGLVGYPFERMTQVHKYRAEVGSNWKLFIDAFAEFYHAPVLHAKQAVADESRKLAGYGFEALAYDIDGPHGMVSSWGGMAPPKDPSMVKPIERVLRSGLFGPWDRPDIGIDDLPPGLNPARSPSWGIDTLRLLPQLHAAGVGPQLVPHVPLLADVPQHPHLRGHAVLRAADDRPVSGSHRSSPRSPSRSTRSRTATPSRRPRPCSSRGAVTQFPLNDQEILLRHLHKTARDHVADYPGPPGRHESRAHLGRVVGRAVTGATDTEERPCRASHPSSPISSRSPTGRCGPRPSATPSDWRSSMDELQAFYDAAFPRLDDAITHCDQFGLDSLPEDAEPAAVALLLARQRVVPRRGVATGPRARQRCRSDRRGGRTGRVTQDHGAHAR